MDRSLSRSLPYLPRYQSLSPARSPCLGGRRFASLRSLSSPSHRQRICYIDAGEATRVVSTSCRARGSPSPKRSYKVHLFGPAFSSDGTKRVHHASRVTRSLSAYDLHSSHMYVSQDALLTGADRQADARRAFVSCQDLYHKGPYFPDATAASESGVSLGGISDESLYLCGGDDMDNLSQHSFGSSSAFHEITFDSEHERCDSSDAYFSGAEGGYSNAHHSGDRLLDVLFEDNPDSQSFASPRRRQNVSSLTSYSENRRRELQLPPNEQDKAQLKTQALRVLIPGSDVPLRNGVSATSFKDLNKSPGEKRVLTSTPLAQSTPHVSPRGVGETKLSILACWNADDSLEDHGIDGQTNSKDIKLMHKSHIARVLFESDISDFKDGSSCNSSQSEDNFSDVSSATVGSYSSRRTKMVKRASDKAGFPKRCASFESDNQNQISQQGLLECKSSTITRAGNEHESRISHSGADSAGTCVDDFGSEEGSARPCSAASDDWQDRQTYHEKNAQALSSVCGGADEGESEDKGEEGDEEGEDEDDRAGLSKKTRSSSRNGRLRGSRNASCSALATGGNAPPQGVSSPGIVSSGKINIPLISAGKHGQEKLRKRVSPPTPLPSAVVASNTSPRSATGQENLSGQDRTSHTGIDSGTRYGSDSDSTEGISDVDGKENIASFNEHGVMETNNHQASGCVTQNQDKKRFTQTTADNEPSTEEERRGAENRYDQENNMREGSNDYEKSLAFNKKGNNKINSPANIQHDVLFTSQLHGRYVGPDEVTETPTVTAGHFTNTARSEEAKGAGPSVVCSTKRWGKEERDGYGSSDRYQLNTAGERDGVEGGNSVDAFVALPESKGGEERMKTETQVSGERERVGERLRLGSSSTSLPSTPLTASRNINIERSSSAVECSSEQSELLHREVINTNSCHPSANPTDNLHSSIDLEKFDESRNDTRFEAGTNVFSRKSDSFKSEIKVSLAPAPLNGKVNSHRDVNCIAYSDSANTTDVEAKEEEEKEKPEFISKFSDAEKQPLCVIGETRSSMERSIDPGFVAGARAASEGETPQIVVVRVMATAQNAAERGTARQACDKDQQQHLKAEFLSRQQQCVSKLPPNCTDRSSHLCFVNKVLESKHGASSCDSFQGKNHFENLKTSVKDTDSNERTKTVSCEHGEINQGQSLNENIPRETNRESIPEQTSGYGQDKGIHTSDKEDTFIANDTDFVSGVGECVVQRKEVEVTEVCHKVVKKIHSTTVEGENVSKDSRFNHLTSHFISDGDSKPGDFARDRSSKTTIVEDTEDTVTTKTTTTTTTTLNALCPSPKRSEIDVKLQDSDNSASAENSSDRNASTKITFFPVPVGRDSLLPKLIRPEVEGCASLQTSTCENILPAPHLPCVVSGQTDVPTTHVMREVKHTWQAQPDPGVTGCPALQRTSSSPTSAALIGVDLYALKRHGNDNYTANQLDSLQAKLAQISGQRDTGDALSSPTPATHKSQSSASSPPYQDHAEATSVLKQIVRGDTDGFPNLPQFSAGYGDYDTVTENGTQVCRDSGPTFYSYTVEVRDSASNKQFSSENVSEDKNQGRESYDNDYDNALPSVTTALPSRHSYSNHHHHHLPLLKPGQLKSSSLWTLQEETESLLEAVSPKPTRRTLTSLASDDEETNSIDDENSALHTNQAQHHTEISHSNLSINSVEQDLSDTAIGHKNCASESSDFDDSDGNYSSISTAESTSYRSSSVGREQTPMSDETDFAPASDKMDYDSSWHRVQGSDLDRVSSFNDFVSGLEQSISAPVTDQNNRLGNLTPCHQHSEQLSTLDSLAESLKQFTQPTVDFDTFPGTASPHFSTFEEGAVTFQSIDNSHFQPSHHHHHHHDHLNVNLNSSLASASTASHHSWFTPLTDDARSEASLRLHALDLDLSRISSCNSPAPSDISEASSAYTCTGTAQIKRHNHHVSFGDTPTAAALLSPTSCGGFLSPVPTSTPKSKTMPVSIIKRPPSPREELRQKYVDENVRQFDQILRDFHKRISPVEAIDDFQIVEPQQLEVLSDKTSSTNISNYDDLYKAFTNDGTEKKQNNVCIVLEDENMSSFRFKRFLRKSHTKRKKGKKIMRFLNKLKCVSEGMSSPDFSPGKKDALRDSSTKNKANSRDDSVQVFSTDSMPSQPPNLKLSVPNPELTSSKSFQHHRLLETSPVNVSSSSYTPSQGSPASSTQSVSSSRSRADSAYSSISESLSHGSGTSPRRLTTLSTTGSSVGSASRGASTSGAWSISASSASFSGTPSEADQTLLSSSKDDSEDMLSALSDVFEQLDVCEGEIDRALLNRMKHGYTRARPARRL
ncbi:hypothetical protein PoB_007098400 [Plakobranchus ocellatus]|uniref:Uncharacterized protein n=1 Tax=Plakobranchus ocellatus TaxID=259542 RepID=A0AAV4DJT8_9GAST|nr:hypothetical protein PoB_007098400 [Plakobranchus ocellatus]